MLKPLVLRRDFSLFTRVPYSRLINSAAHNGHESIIIHRVRIRQPFFRRSRLVGTFIFATATFAIVQSLGVKVEVEIKEIEAKDKKPSPSASPEEDGWTTVGQEVDEDEDEEEEEEEEEALLFLPTGFSRPQKKTFYKGTDPEWQEFRKLATDRPRLEKIRGDLVSTLRGTLAKNPNWILKLGKVDTSKGKTWLEFKFPDGPPVEYERPGIELTENLEWRKATRPVNFSHHDRLKRLMYPKEVADALYNDTTNKVKGLWKGFQVYMGWHQESKSDTVQQLVQRIAANPQSSASQPTTTTPDPASASSTDSQQPSITTSSAPIDGPPKDLGFVLPEPKKLTLDLSRFRAEFQRAFKPSPPPLPRGVFYIIGLVEVYGARARSTFSVIAIYDPKQAPQGVAPTKNF
ncbi:predicted protein [Pyrenophora tritici-repentis Pt-1C-BFP]|uniref:Uncharacterized protein n=1 Tax=Pyrenophora tritici-repentis (strain Pt-1C-BFP) TaxID=426418 RepID=B2WD06_PYRTR|nr:uncharacterized protein PTRG_07865 [Pyrenophora tritici-repentis Pt-1C-BFP]EDU50784.1 predicted protein [Pyrenophora tritici-repentis Pt-1C-BFP]